MKTINVLEAFNILNVAKYSKLEDGDKIKIWKIVRELKPIATKFQEDTKDASERFMQEFDNFQENLQKAQEYERDRATMTEEQYKSFVNDFVKYNKLVQDAVNEFAEAEVILTAEKISEDAFGKLMASNDWTIDQTNKIDFIIE